MKGIIALATLAAAMAAITAPAFAGVDGIRVPEPVSLSLLAGGVAAIAAVRHFRRK